MVDRLNVNEAVNNADTRTDQRDQHEAEDKRIVGNSTDKTTDPTDSTGNKRTDIRNHVGDSIRSCRSLKNHPFIIN